MMNKYRLPISLIFNFATPLRRLRHVIGSTVQLYPRTTVFNGNSTVRLKCGDKNGVNPSSVVLR